MPSDGKDGKSMASEANPINEMDTYAAEAASTSTSNLAPDGNNAAQNISSITTSSAFPDYKGKPVEPIALEQPPFRSLDLAAELRNRIYEYSLQHDRNTGQGATPALLRTCKQVNQEATGILYAQSTFTMEVAFSKMRYDDYAWYFEVGGDVSLDLESSAEKIFNSLPMGLAKAHNVKIIAEANDYATIMDNWTIRKFLYAVCSFLAGRCKDLKHFTLQATATNTMPLGPWAMLGGMENEPHFLYPLAKLPRTTTVHLPDIPRLEHYATMYFDDGRPKQLPSGASANILDEYTSLQPKATSIRKSICLSLKEPGSHKREEHQRILTTLVQIQALARFVESGQDGFVVYSISGDAEMVQRLKWLRLLLDIHEKNPHEPSTLVQDENGEYFIELTEDKPREEGWEWFRTEVQKCREAMWEARQKSGVTI